jgi:hypothetical protein
MRLKNLAATEFSGVHKPCVSPIGLPFLDTIEKSEPVIWWKEVSNFNGKIRDIVMMIAEADKSESIRKYLATNSIMKAGKPEFEALIKGYSLFEKDLGGVKAYTVAFMIVDKSEKAAGKRVTDFLRTNTCQRIPAVEIDMNGKETGIALSKPEDQNLVVENLYRKYDLEPLSINRVPPKLTAKKLYKYTKLELLLYWLCSYHIARLWKEHLKPIADKEDEKLLEDTSRSFADAYVNGIITNKRMFTENTFDFIVANQVDKVLQGKDIPILFRKTLLTR